LVEKSQKNLLCLLDRGYLMGDPILSVISQQTTSILRFIDLAEKKSKEFALPIDQRILMGDPLLPLLYFSTLE
jgi:hypothetical protein